MRFEPNGPLGFFFFLIVVLKNLIANIVLTWNPQYHCHYFQLYWELVVVSYIHWNVSIAHNHWGWRSMEQGKTTTPNATSQHSKTIDSTIPSSSICHFTQLEDYRGMDYFSLCYINKTPLGNIRCHIQFRLCFKSCT